jgi:hypothetical protein
VVRGNDTVFYKQQFLTQVSEDSEAAKSAKKNIKDEYVCFALFAALREKLLL